MKTGIVRNLALAGCTVGLGALASAANQMPQLISLGNNNRPTGMSSDGTVIAGLQGSTWFRWTEAGGVVSIGGDAMAGNASVSSDGNAIVATAINPGNGFREAALWQGGTNWMTLGAIAGATQQDGGLSSGWGIDGTGATVVGLSRTSGVEAHGFSYTSLGGVVDLGSTVVGRSSRANSISADGSRIVGWQDSSTGTRQGAMWFGGVQTVFIEGDGTSVGEAQAVTPDGSIVCGGFSGVSNREAWYWTQADGIVPIGNLVGFNFRAFATDLTDDGSVVVGFAGFGFDRDAFIWDAVNGIQKLDDVLTAQGLDLTAWDLGTVTGISGDGLTITGWGAGPQGVFEGWVVQLPEPIFNYCTGKVNSLGCVPFVSTTGCPSVADTTPFVIQATDLVPTEATLLLYSIGKANLNFHGGKLCVKAPIKRLLPVKAATNTGNPPCTGVTQRNFNNRIQSGADALLTVGQTTFAQYLQRDPADPAGFGDSLSDAVRFVVGP